MKTVANQEILFKNLNAELNPICHLLALLGAHHVLHVTRVRVKSMSASYNLQYSPYAYWTVHHLDI